MRMRVKVARAAVSDEAAWRKSRRQERGAAQGSRARGEPLAVLGNRVISRRVASGLPAGLRSSIEDLAGVSMGGVRVHPASSEPDRHDAHSLTRGDDIHLGPGREGDLAHEAWHVAQQRQGRVTATGESAGTPLNHDSSLEAEADAMGETARSRRASSQPAPVLSGARAGAFSPVQLKCKFCNAKSHNEKNCPKNPDKKEEEGGGGRAVTKAGKKQKELFAAILPKLDREMMYGPGAKSLVGGYNGKPNGLRDNSIRIDRQGLGNVQFQIGDDSYACATFEQDAKPGAIIAALYRSLESGENEAA